MWVVDLNRQSLDRVVPDIAAGRLAAMFEAAGWHTVMVKYGPRLQQAPRPARPHRRDAQRGVPAAAARRRAPSSGSGIEVDVDDLDDDELLATFRDLGGHDLAGLIDGYRQADEVRDRPERRLRLHDQGLVAADRGPPRQPLGAAQPRAVPRAGGQARRGPGRPVRAARARLTRGASCARRRDAGSSAARRRAVRAPKRPAGPRPQAHRRARRPSRRSAASSSTSCARRRTWPTRVVTVAPDVGTSTNLGGWINKAGIWSLGERIDWFADDTDTLVRWRESRPRPPHRARHRRGQPRRPARRAGRDVVARRPAAAAGRHDLRPVRVAARWSRGRSGIYAGGQSILVGTPVRRHARPRGRRAPVGDHAQSIGIEQPGCVAYEPAFGQDFEWCFLHALSQLGKPGGTSAYFRLSTRPIDQSLPHRHARGGARGRLHACGGTTRRSVVIAVMGALVPEALAAADTLTDDAGLAVEVVCVTSADLLFRSFQARSGLGDGDPRTLDAAVPQGRPDRQPRSTATRTR